jgi:hypothetical protein
LIEVKAPGKGADPRKFSDPHDKEQWDKLKSLPNLMDGFSLDKTEFFRLAQMQGCWPTVRLSQSLLWRKAIRTEFARTRDLPPPGERP